ncbi:MAG TPA: IS5 family transposase [Rhizomicrobium sp.]
MGDCLRDPQWTALARCAEGLWPAQDDLQPLHPLEPSWGVQPDIRRACGEGRQARTADDRCHASQSPSHRCQSAQKGAVPRRIGRTKGGLNSKLHAVCDGEGRPLVMLLSEGQMSDYKGAALMLDALPPAKTLLGDRGYDAGWFRNALAERGIAACIPSKLNRKIPIHHDRKLYRQRHKIENMFGKLKDWRRIHTRYDRCAHTFFSAICIAAIVIFWINQ